MTEPWVEYFTHYLSNHGLTVKHISNDGKTLKELVEKNILRTIGYKSMYLNEYEYLWELMSHHSVKTLNDTHAIRELYKKNVRNCLIFFDNFDYVFEITTKSPLFDVKMRDAVATSEERFLLGLEVLKGLEDVYIVAPDSSWVYAQNHYSDVNGPYYIYIEEVVGITQVTDSTDIDDLLEEQEYHERALAKQDYRDADLTKTKHYQKQYRKLQDHISDEAYKLLEKLDNLDIDLEYQQILETEKLLNESVSTDDLSENTSHKTTIIEDYTEEEKLEEAKYSRHGYKRQEIKVPKNIEFTDSEYTFEEREETYKDLDMEGEAKEIDDAKEQKIDLLQFFNDE